MHLVRRRIYILLIFMLRRGRQQRWNRTIRPQAPIVYRYRYPIAFDHPREYLFLAPVETFEIEKFLPMSLPVFTRDFLFAHVELSTGLLHDGMKDAGVDCHKEPLDLEYRNNIEALLQKESPPFLRLFIFSHHQLHLRFVFGF